VAATDVSVTAAAARTADAASFAFITLLSLDDHTRGAWPSALRRD
jgi:hypothetical protein